MIVGRVASPNRLSSPTEPCGLARGPLVAHHASRERWGLAATEIAEGLKNYSPQDAAYHAAMAAFESVDDDALAVEIIIKSMWDAPDWSLSSVALAAYKAGKARRDSDGSPKGRDAEERLGAEHDSAGPKDIAQPTPEGSPS